MAPTTPRKSGFLEEAARSAFLLFCHAFPREMPSGRISGAAPRMVRRGGRSVPQFALRLPVILGPCLAAGAVLILSTAPRLCLSGTDTVAGLDLEAQVKTLATQSDAGIMPDCRRRGRNRIIANLRVPGDLDRRCVYLLFPSRIWLRLILWSQMASDFMSGLLAAR